jgi:hypothetical protein
MQIAMGEVERTIEKKACTDGQFAIAYSNLLIAEELARNVEAIKKLGFGDAVTDGMGAIELYAIKQEELQRSLVDAISDFTESLGEISLDWKEWLSGKE